MEEIGCGMPLPLELQSNVLGRAGTAVRLVSSTYLKLADEGRHSLTIRAPDAYKCPYDFEEPEQLMKLTRLLQLSPGVQHVTYRTHHWRRMHMSIAPLHLSTNLRSLRLERVILATSESSLSVLSPLTRLTRLEMLMAPQMETVLPLASLPHLAHLTLCVPFWLGLGLPDLTSSCTMLSYLDLSGCRGLTSLDAVSALGAALVTLKLMDCDGVTDISQIASACVNLAHLAVRKSGVTCLRAFQHSTALCELSPHSTFSDADVLHLPTSLEVLDVTGCRQLTRQPSHASRWTLRGSVGDLGIASDNWPPYADPWYEWRSFNLFADTSGIVDLSALADHPGFFSVRMRDCINLTDVSGLAACTALRSLSLRGCTGVRHLPVCSLAYVNIVFLNLSYTCVTDLAPLSVCTALTTCDIRATQVVSLTPLSACSRLCKLYMLDCPSVTDVSPLAACAVLRDLYLCGCTGITDLCPLDGLRYRCNCSREYRSRLLAAFYDGRRHYWSCTCCLRIHTCDVDDA